LHEGLRQQPRRVVGVLGGPGAPSVLELADWCGVVFGAQPLAVQRTTGQAVSCLELDYGEGRSAQLINCACTPRLEVFTADWKVVVALPRRLWWRDISGHHAQLLPRFPPGFLLLRDFHQAVVKGETPDWSLVDVLRLQERPRLVDVLRLQGRL
jgi:hypothetical protein